VADADGLAAFVAGLPDGKRHRGTFWALATAVEGGLSDAEISIVSSAAVRNGLDEDYVQRTLAEVRDREHG
jgi:hypothetical protein